MTPPEPTAADPARQDPSRWDRRTAADARAAFRDPHTPPPSQRRYADAHGVPRATLGHWLRQGAPDGLDPDLAACLRGPAGERFLRRLTLALLLVFHHEHACGLRPVGRFLRLAELDRFVGSSYGALHTLAGRVQADLAAFDDQERDRLAPAMAPREIAVCADEHFHAAQPCLVAVEPLSDFLLLEAYHERRDADTWTGALQEALRGLPLTVVLLCSDRAKGLLACAKDGLQVAHSPDLLHAQRDLLGPLLLPLARQAKQAEQEAEQERARAQYWRDEQAKEAAGPPRPGRRFNYARRIGHHQAMERHARQDAAAARARQEQVVAAVRGLADEAHPFDPQTGQRLEAAAVGQRLERRLSEVQQGADEAQRGGAAAAGLKTGRAWATALVGVVAWFWGVAQRRVEGWGLPEAAEKAVYAQLLPGLYWQQQARRGRDAEQRRQRRALAEPLLQAAWSDDGALAALPAEQRDALARAGRQLVGLFARSSSCVEGRNGRLALLHHGHGPLSSARLKAQTALHNYFSERSDGTTAAERFFGQKPRDLFGWLLERLPDLPRPAARRPNRGPQAPAPAA